MKSFALVLVAVLLGASEPAVAEDLDMSTIRCKDFVAASKADIGTILVWLEGYYTKDSDPPILHFDKMAEDGKKLGEYCAAHGEDGIIKAAEEVMPVK
jgi:acid stress chaperone HdeB